MSSAPQAPAPTSPDPNTPPQTVGQQLLAEISAFRKNCDNRYHFNNNWDTGLTLLGILLSIAVIAAGFLKRPEVSAVLGAIIGAIVTAQKAFPFGQRASFYRLLVGQTDNLLTRATEGLWNRKEVVDTLSTLRMDYAQQLPRGSSTPADPAPPSPPHPAHPLPNLAPPLPTTSHD